MQEQLEAIDCAIDELDDFIMSLPLEESVKSGHLYYAMWGEHSWELRSADFG